MAYRYEEFPQDEFAPSSCHGVCCELDHEVSEGHSMIWRKEVPGGGMSELTIFKHVEERGKGNRSLGIGIPAGRTWVRGHRTISQSQQPPVSHRGALSGSRKTRDPALTNLSQSSPAPYAPQKTARLGPDVPAMGSPAPTPPAVSGAQIARVAVF